MTFVLLWILYIWVFGAGFVTASISPPAAVCLSNSLVSFVLLYTSLSAPVLSCRIVPCSC